MRCKNGLYRSDSPYHPNVRFIVCDGQVFVFGSENILNGEGTRWESDKGHRFRFVSDNPKVIIEE